MKKKQLTVQLTLILIGLFLFALTYLYYPNIGKDKFITEEPAEKDFVKEEPKETVNIDQSTAFENIEYKGLYDFDKPFKVRSENAYILNDQPDLVYMKNMHVILYLSDNRIIEITSLTGLYNKSNYNCYFEEDILATDGEIIITANNLDLLATENFAEIYNDVNLNYITGSLKADKVEYNFETKNFKVSMFDDKTIKMKVIQ